MSSRLKIGDLVRFNHPFHTPKSEEIVGMVVGDSVRVGSDGSSYRDIWWMIKERISPINLDYLELISESKE